MSEPLIYVIEVTGTAEYFKELLASHLGDKVEVVLGYTASDLWQLMQTRGRPDAMIVQRKINYGPEILAINPNLNSMDERQEHAGSRILRYIHEHSVVLSQMYVVLLDGRDAAFPGPVDRATTFLREHQLLAGEYLKPFDTIEFIVRFCDRFGLENPYPSIRDWEPEDSVVVEDGPGDEDESEG